MLIIREDFSTKCFQCLMLENFLGKVASLSSLCIQFSLKDCHVICTNISK